MPHLPLHAPRGIRRFSAEIVHTGFVGILPAPASRRSIAGVPPGIRGGRVVEERQRHREDARPDRNGLPRWPAAVALLAIGALYAELSDGLTLGPRAFLLGLVIVLLVPPRSEERRVGKE